nr:hypothetical protein C1892_19625 [Pseudomonas sp. MPBD7-1]
MFIATAPGKARCLPWRSRWSWRAPDQRRTQADPTRSRASSLPQGIYDGRTLDGHPGKTVGASLLAIAVCLSPRI